VYPERLASSNTVENFTTRLSVIVISKASGTSEDHLQQIIIVIECGILTEGKLKATIRTTVGSNYNRPNCESREQLEIGRELAGRTEKMRRKLQYLRDLPTVLYRYLPIM
jgi:hypothetical protein